MRRARMLVAVVGAMAVLPWPGATAVAQEDADGPIVGTPPLEEAIPGWVETYTDPVYYEAYVREAITSAHLRLPWPFDVVKPEAFLVNVPVAVGDEASALPVEDTDLTAVEYEWEGTTRTVGDFLHATASDAIAFVHDGVLVEELYANGYGPDVRHQPWSVTKTFVAALVGIAEAEGHIPSLQDPIDAHIPDLAGTAWESVTIENILQMESGVHWDEGTPVLVQNTQVEQWVQLAIDLYTDGNAGQTRNEFLAALPKAYEQGTEFRYNSGNTQVLAWLLETIYDAPFNEILSEKLWQPMGAAGDAVMIADRTGAVVASQGLYARPHDFARFGELMRNGGRTPEGRQVVPADWVEAMVTMTDVSDGGYGYQTWAHRIAGPDAYSASGFQGQKITVVPSQCVTGVRLSHALGADLREGDDPMDPDAYGFAVVTFAEEWQAMLAAVAEHLGGCPDATGGDADQAPVADDGDVAGAPVGADDAEDGSPLPATGGGRAALALLALGAGALLYRRVR